MSLSMSQSRVTDQGPVHGTKLNLSRVCKNGVCGFIQSRSKEWQTAQLRRTKVEECEGKLQELRRYTDPLRQTKTLLENY